MDEKVDKGPYAILLTREDVDFILKLIDKCGCEQDSDGIQCEHYCKDRKACASVWEKLPAHPYDEDCGCEVEE